MHISEQCRPLFENKNLIDFGAWDLPFQSYEAKGNFNKAKEICPMVQLLIAADGLASQVLEGK